MGQMTTGILYGCEVPGELRKVGKDCNLICEMVEEFNDSTKGRHVSTPPPAGRYLVGVWAASWGDPDDKATLDADGTCVRLDEIDALPTAAGACEAWGRFAAWCRERGVTLPAAAWWLAPIEIA